MFPSSITCWGVILSVVLIFRRNVPQQCIYCTSLTSLIVVLKSMTMYDSIQHLHHFLKDKILPLLSFYVYFSLEFQTVCLNFWGFGFLFGFFW